MTYESSPINAGQMRPGPRALRIFLLGVLLIGCVPGCHRDVADPPDGILRIGVLPDERTEVLRSKYQPLMHYLEQALKMDCELIIPESYEELERVFADGTVDLAWFGGYTFAICHGSYGAVPLVSRDVDLHFTSYFLARSGRGNSDPADFRGERLAFGSKLSTSGHLMPRYFLSIAGIAPEDFFREVVYTQSHDQTAYAVRDGRADLGVASSAAISDMFRSGRLTFDTVEVIRETPPYVNYVWACQADLSPALRDRIRNAFLALSTQKASQTEILRRLRAEYFLPVSSDDFDELRTIIDSLDMSDIQ